MKRILCLILTICLFAALCVPAFADSSDCVVVGADLSESQILQVYEDFGILRGSVLELTVTNSEERDYLEGLVSESVIGTRSLSCIYIRLLSEGKGLTVSTNNISWCTQDMYKSALMTAGIYDAEVFVTAPFSVSGTAALTGVYKAYEQITGETLDEEAKEAAADELVLTAELADEISEEDAVAIVNDLKLLLDETAEMSDEELSEQIQDIASGYGYTLDTEWIDKLIELVRSLEKLDISELTEKVESFRNTLETAGEYAQQAITFGQKLAQFLGKVAEAFRGIFGSSEE